MKALRILSLICFAHTIPIERTPKKIKRAESRLFVTFRKEEKIKNELSVTSGHAYKQSSVIAKSGKINKTIHQSFLFVYY